MKFELKIIPKDERELLHIAAKLRDIESLVTDSIPFFPNDPSVYSKPKETNENFDGMSVCFSGDINVLINNKNYTTDEKKEVG